MEALTLLGKIHVTLRKKCDALQQFSVVAQQIEKMTIIETQTKAVTTPNSTMYTSRYAE